ncbi:MAG: hypothetical protein WC895_04855 [Candidatus Shapirobacteria bacterium]|jgi:hypothetical protein
MTCSICTDLSSSQLTELSRLFRSNVPLEELCIQFQSTPEAITSHCHNCIDISTREKLEHVLKESFRQVEIARKQHEEEPSQETSYAYTAIMREVRELSKTLDSMRSDEDTLKALLERMLFPFTREALNMIISELRATRDTMYALTDKRMLVDQAIERAGTRASQRLKEQQEKAINTIAIILNVSTSKNPLTERELTVLQGGKQ